MKPTGNLTRLIVTLFCLYTACSVIKNDDHDKEIRDFLTRIQHAMIQPSDSLINKYFHTNQSRETIVEALTVLQNRDSSGIKCRVDFQLATIVFFEKRTEVTIPVVFDSVHLEENINMETYVRFWLEPGNNGFVITELDAAEFYQNFTAIKNARLWADEYAHELLVRSPIYATADSLENYLDSVIWYATYNQQIYFYAVKGSWYNYFMENAEPQQEEYSMGLVNALGDTLIPFEYDLIGSIAFAQPAMVEVKRDAKYGYFNLDSGKIVIEPLYDMIVPYSEEGSNVWALVLQDTTYGWLSTEYDYVDGYPSEAAQKFAEEYSYLQESIVLKAGNQIFCEVPSKEHVGYGIIIPPSYYVKNNLFDPIVGGINTTKVPMNGWTDYIESKKSMVARIGDEIRALIAVMEERYIGGREEFYGSSQVTFVNASEEEIGSTDMPTDQEIIFTHLGNGILELKATQRDITITLQVMSATFQFISILR